MKAGSFASIATRVAAAPAGEREEVRPAESRAAQRRRLVAAPEHDHVLDGAAGDRERAVHDLLEAASPCPSAR